MARTELRPLLDRRVYVTGTVARHQRRPEGHYDVMISGVAVRPYHCDEPLLRPAPIELDHLWTICPPTVYKIGDRIASLGVVHQYARTDGSVDYGVRAVESLLLPDVLRELKAAIAGGTIADRAWFTQCAYLQLSESLATGALVHPSRHQSAARAVAEIKAVADAFQRDLEAETKALTGSVFSRCRRPTPPPRLAGSPRPAAVGFG